MFWHPVRKFTGIFRILIELIEVDQMDIIVDFLILVEIPFNQGTLQSAHHLSS